jgi:uncharacterized membrane protein
MGSPRAAPRLGNSPGRNAVGEVGHYFRSRIPKEARYLAFLETISHLRPRKRGDEMSPESRRLAGMLLVILPTVMIGGVSILTLLINDPAYMQNQLRQDLWRAGHAHAGVLLVLSLVALRYVDETQLTARLKWFVRLSMPSAAILLPSAFFLSVLRPDATEPNGQIALAYVGAVVLAGGVVVLGVGLLRTSDN